MIIFLEKLFLFTISKDIPYIDDPKSIYILLLLILTKYEIIIFAAGPAETKKIKLFCLACSDNF